jgi:superfamily II RNA helicase
MAQFFILKKINKMSNVREGEMVDLANRVQHLLWECQGGMFGEDITRKAYDLANELVADWLHTHKIEIL